MGIFIEIQHNIKTGAFRHETNLKEDKVADFLCEYLRSQMGKGKDASEPEDHDEYVVRIELDLSDDSFKVKSNTGNKSLREGIVSAFLSQLNPD